MSTYKLLIGILVYAAWIVLLALGSGLWLGLPWGLATLAALPALGFWGNGLRERWRAVRRDVERFVRVRRVRGTLEALRAEQDALAIRLDEVFRRHESGALLQSDHDGEGDRDRAEPHQQGE